MWLFHTSIVCQKRYSALPGDGPVAVGPVSPGRLMTPAKWCTMTSAFSRRSFEVVSPFDAPISKPGTVEVLHLASSLEACPVQRIEWYFEACLKCCQGLTPHELVAAGRGNEVIGFLRRSIGHEAVEWRSDEA